ncbi:hypothetical protein FOHLNKBM_5804 [Methylobacterium longum]|nr:hypothetical protein FOHLNKBM_5804 [Methylobacterium longum]
MQARQTCFEPKLRASDHRLQSSERCDPQVGAAVLAEIHALTLATKCERISQSVERQP